MTNHSLLAIILYWAKMSPLRKIGRLERFLGPENYRIVIGLLKTPASIAGFILIGLFVLIAVLPR